MSTPTYANASVQVPLPFEDRASRLAYILGLCGIVAREATEFLVDWPEDEAASFLQDVLTALPSEEKDIDHAHDTIANKTRLTREAEDLIQSAISESIHATQAIKVEDDEDELDNPFLSSPKHQRQNASTQLSSHPRNEPLFTLLLNAAVERAQASPGSDVTPSSTDTLPNPGSEFLSPLHINIHNHPIDDAPAQEQTPPHVRSFREHIDTERGSRGPSSPLPPSSQSQIVLPDYATPSPRQARSLAPSPSPPPLQYPPLSPQVLHHSLLDIDTLPPPPTSSPAIVSRILLLEEHAADIPSSPAPTGTAHGIIGNTDSADDDAAQNGAEESAGDGTNPDNDGLGESSTNTIETANALLISPSPSPPAVPTRAPTSQESTTHDVPQPTDLGTDLNVGTSIISSPISGLSGQLEVAKEEKGSTQDKEDVHAREEKADDAAEGDEKEKETEKEEVVRDAKGKGKEVVEKAETEEKEKEVPKTRTRGRGRGKAKAKVVAEKAEVEKTVEVKEKPKPRGRGKGKAKAKEPEPEPGVDEEENVQKREAEQGEEKRSISIARTTRGGGSTNRRKRAREEDKEAEGQRDEDARPTRRLRSSTKKKQAC